MKNTTPNSQSAHQEKKETEAAEKSNVISQADPNDGQAQTGKSKDAKPAEKQQAKESRKSTAAPKVPKVPEAASAPEGSGRSARSGKPKQPRKQHKKKGSANDAPPSSVGMTQVAFAALLVIEAANPEMTRKQIFENALKLLAGQIAYLPPIQLARLDRDTLITMAGASAKWEKSCKEIMRKITLSELDDEEKSIYVSALETEIQHLREERLILCRTAGIPISHYLIIDLEFVIGKLLILRDEETENSFQSAYDKAIRTLKAYIPAEPPKPSE